MENKVLIVDEHPVMSLALTSWLKQHGFNVVAQACNGIEAMQFISEHKPHVVLMEIDIPCLNGFVVIERIRLLDMPVKTIVFSAQNSRFVIINCVLAGAYGFVSKTEDGNVLLSAIRTVQSGLKYYPDWVQQEGRLNVTGDPMGRLSSRERQVLQLLTQGLSNNQVAARMQLSCKTTSTFKVRALKKLNANTLMDLLNRTK
ncbi:response regulator [Pseudomonas sp. NPDC087346]|uniref:response regulator n=1 Tax=Pseudomonas sp. NPDC087346 TaxID=3364438 RepID=UPI00382870EA